METTNNQNTESGASTNPINNVVKSNPNGLTDAQVKAGYSTIEGKYDPVTGKLKTQSTTTLSSDKSKDILNANNALTTLTNKGITTDPQTGVAKYSNGEVYNEPEAPDLKTADTQEEERQIEKAFEEMKKNTDAIAAGSIAQIQSQFARLKEEQKKVNESQLAGTKSALIMSGAMQHDVYSDDAIAYRVNQGQKAIIDLENQENELINAAKAAQLAGNNRILEAKVAEINKVREEKIKETEALNKTITEAFQKKQEINDKIQTEDAIYSLYEQGVTDPAQISKQLRAAGYPASLKDVSDNVALISGIGGAGIVGEYNFYKAEAIKAGQVPMDFNAYQNADANRKKSIAEAGVTSSDTKKTNDTTIDKSSDSFIQGLLNTKGGKALTDTTIQKLDKGLTTLGQLGVLQANIEGVKTGPIAGAFKGANPWDTKGQTIKAQLNAIVPNLARGIYGEVGVLTDNDIKTYSKTIPNLKSTKEVRDAILYITLDMIGKSIKNTLSVNKAAGRDVSGFVDIYTEMENTKNSILSSIPGAQVPDSIKTSAGLIESGNQAKSTIDSYYLSATPDIRSKINALYDKGIDDLTILQQLKARGLIKE